MGYKQVQCGVYELHPHAPTTDIADAEASAEKRKAQHAAADDSTKAAEPKKRRKRESAGGWGEVVTIEDDLEPDEYRPAFLLRAADALTFAVYSGPVDAEVVAAAGRAAAEWKALEESLAERLREDDAGRAA
jgi:hypothetical protein